MSGASRLASGLSSEPGAVAGRQSRSATTSTSSIWSGTNASSAKATRPPTPCTTRAATTSDAATCTRWDVAPPHRGTGRAVSMFCALLRFPSSLDSHHLGHQLHLLVEEPPPRLNHVVHLPDQLEPARADHLHP